MDDLSNPRNMAMRVKLLEEYKREHNGTVKKLFLSCCHTTEQGVKVINEWQISSTIEIFMEIRSSGNLSDVVFGIVKDLIDKKIVQFKLLLFKSRLLKNRLIILAKVCLMLLVKMQFGRLKPNLSNQIPLASTQKQIQVLLRSGGNKRKAKAPVVPQPV